MASFLSLMLQHNFTTFLTIDNNTSFQQNFKDYPLTVVVIIAPDNTYQTIMEIFQHIVSAIESLPEKVISVIHPSHSSH